MTPEEILPAVQEEIAAALGLDPAEAGAGKLLVADLGAESIDFIDLTFRIEKRFQLEIPEGELFESKTTATLTVGAVAEYIQKHL